MCKFEQHNQNIIDDDTESVTSVNSYAQLDNIWDGETIELTTDDEGEVEPGVTPPRKKLKTQYSPVMFSNLVYSNFIYHTSKSIILPKNHDTVAVGGGAPSNSRFHIFGSSSLRFFS